MSGVLKTIGERLKAFRVPGYYTKYDHYWTMVVDLDKCNGCAACTVACYAENNIPVVGDDQCAKGRVFNWIRLEKYVEGEYPDVKIRHIPIMCQQCSKAPCETGCPVYATYHNQDGLNVQVYNRCVGTFTCATYCPYDVRRFNWHTYKFEKPLEQQLNPDVTVREMGVMEKCTFCIQRIRAAKDKAKDEGRKIQDGDVKPACVQTCPTGAMVFGDLNDTGSEVYRLASNARTYRLLDDLNTVPSVIYLKRVSDNGRPTHE